MYQPRRVSVHIQLAPNFSLLGANWILGQKSYFEACTCVEEVLVLSVSSIFRLDFWTVLTLWYILFFITLCSLVWPLCCGKLLHDVQQQSLIWLLLFLPVKLIYCFFTNICNGWYVNTHCSFKTLFWVLSVNNETILVSRINWNIKYCIL